MNEKSNTLPIALAVVAIVIAISVGAMVLLNGTNAPSSGSSGSRFQHGVSVGTNVAAASNGFVVGDNGSEFVELKGATCNLSHADTSIAASSTGYVYCTGITGVASGDVVLAQLSSTTPNTGFKGWAIVSAISSSTAGAIDMMLLNLTGTASVPSATNIGSSTNIWYADITP